MLILKLLFGYLQKKGLIKYFYIYESRHGHVQLLFKEMDLDKTNMWRIIIIVLEIP